MIKSMEQEWKVSMKDAVPDKKKVRQLIRRKKSELSSREVHQRSLLILEQFYQSLVYQKAEAVYTYVNYNEEVETSLLIEHSLSMGKKVCVPRVEGDHMDFYEITSLLDLSSGSYGILEPGSTCVKVSNPCGLMIMPGLAFDLRGHRIGYGGGFYDRYLEKYPNFRKIALCFDFQLFDELQTEEQDIPVDEIWTEKDYVCV
ncbi:MAG: 5-formyltetrahydrofolate cyclo-ligase [Lachnospiraceae bacterium]